MAGCLLIFSALVLDASKRLDSKNAGGDKHSRQFELIGTVALGGFLCIVGLVGLLAGFFAITLTLKSTFVLSFLLFSLETQIRLLIKKQTINSSLKTHDISSNALSMLAEAYSIGFFPKVGRCIYLVYVCQFTQLLLWILIFI